MTAARHSMKSRQRRSLIATNESVAGLNQLPRPPPRHATTAVPPMNATDPIAIDAHTHVEVSLLEPVRQPDRVRGAVPQGWVRWLRAAVNGAPRGGTIGPFPFDRKAQQ